MSFWADRNTFKSYLDTFDVLLTQIKSRAYCGTPEVIQLAHQLEMGASVKSLFPQLPFTVVRSNKKRIFLNHSCLFYPTKPYSPSPVISGITIKNKSARIVDFCLSSREISSSLYELCKYYIVVFYRVLFAITRFRFTLLSSTSVN